MKKTQKLTIAAKHHAPRTPMEGKLKINNIKKKPQSKRIELNYHNKLGRRNASAPKKIENKVKQVIRSTATCQLMVELERFLYQALVQYDIS